MSFTGLAWGLLAAIATTAVRANVPLTRANVESLHRQVEILPRGRAARPARLSDRLGVGDALRTSTGARAELRFNDGSLARIGERATFRFVPNTRNFRLSNGTVLFLVPPGRGSTTIRTPSAVTGIQGTALIVRHIPFATTDTAVSMIDSLNKEQASFRDESSSGTVDGSWSEEQPGRTIVMVLTDSHVQVTATNGATTTLGAGQMAVIEPDSISVVGFDLPLLYNTSPLLEGLQLGDSDFAGTGSPTDPVYQEIVDGLEVQSTFVSGYLLNPEILSGEAQVTAAESWFISDEVLTATDGTSVSAMGSTHSSGGGRCGGGQSGGLMAGGFARCVSTSRQVRASTAVDALPPGLFGVEDNQTANSDHSAQPTSPTQGVKPPTGGTSGPGGEGSPAPIPTTPPGGSVPNQPNAPVNPTVPSVPAPTVPIDPPSTPVGTPAPAPTPTPTPPGAVSTPAPQPSPTVVVSPPPVPTPVTPVASPAPAPTVTPVTSPTPTPSATPVTPPAPAPSAVPVTPPGAVATPPATPVASPLPVVEQALPPTPVNPTPSNTPSAIPENFTPPGLINTGGPVEGMSPDGAN